MAPGAVACGRGPSVPPRPLPQAAVSQRPAATAHDSAHYDDTVGYEKISGPAGPRLRAALRRVGYAARRQRCRASSTSRAATPPPIIINMLSLRSRKPCALTPLLRPPTLRPRFSRPNLVTGILPPERAPLEPNTGALDTAWTEPAVTAIPRAPAASVILFLQGVSLRCFRSPRPSKRTQIPDRRAERWTGEEI